VLLMTFNISSIALVCGGDNLVEAKCFVSVLVLPGDSLVKLPDQENKEELPNCGFDGEGSPFFTQFLSF